LLEDFKKHKINCIFQFSLRKQFKPVKDKPTLNFPKQWQNIPVDSQCCNFLVVSLKKYDSVCEPENTKKKLLCLPTGIKYKN
jgi:hypothetical protein